MAETMACEGKFVDPESGYALVFEDDGRVAYAYLLDPLGEIASDVWLYNRGPTPAEPEWQRRELAPYANPAGYCVLHEDFRPVDDIAEVAVEWGTADDGTVKADVYLRNELFGIVSQGVEPGWSRFALKDGPLANVLPEAPTAVPA